MKRLYPAILLCAAFASASAQEILKDDEINIVENDAMRAKVEANTDKVDQVAHLTPSQRAEVKVVYMWQEHQAEAVRQRFEIAHLTPEQVKVEGEPQAQMRAKHVDEKLSNILTGAQLEAWRRQASSKQ